jgi:hypothetical protein
LGGNTSTFNYVGLGTNFVGRVYIAGYALENDVVPGIVVYGSTGGLSLINNDYLFYPTDRDSDGVMYRVVLTSNRLIDVSILTNPRGEIAAVKNKGLLEVLNEWLKFAIEIASLVLEFLTVFTTYLKFFFWESLLLIIAMWIGLTAAISFGNGGNIFSALKKFFGYQKKLLDFMMSTFGWLVDMLNKMANIFK